VYLALADAGLWWAAGLAVLASILTMVALVRPAYRLFWGPAPEGAIALDATREVPAGLWVPMAVLALACLLLGVLPGLANALLHQGALLLATVGG
jgi:formate hydrogenlyase subunit 3/multisubunit Na+/H+ antiporter MnhD subunit